MFFRWILLGLLISVGARADDGMLGGVGTKIAASRSIAFTTLAGGTVGGSPIAGSGTYTGTAPASLSSATWTGCGGGSSTPAGFSAAAGTWSATFTVPGSSGSGCTIAITDNLSDTATSPGVTITGGSSFGIGPHVAFVGQNGGTTTAIDTTGMKLIVISTSQYKLVTIATPTDNKGNTWTPLTAQPGAVDVYVRLFYCISCTVGTGHTFTVVGVPTYGSFQVESFSDSAGTPSFDTQCGAAFSVPGTTLACGSMTPANPNSIVVTGFSTDYNSGNATVTTGYTITDQNVYVAGVSEGAGMAYLNQTAATLTNPTWTVPGTATDMAVVGAVFAP